jgi:sterol desaturase/sphingolipid hydroxylase (fatty acid hydroxylase superfamily)
MGTSTGALPAIVRGREIKKLNALTAAACGGIPAVVFFLLFPATPVRWLLGFVFGLIWSNWFEYAYHRYLLHWPGTFFAKEHLRHHMSVNTPSEAEHLNLGGSPMWVVLLFVINGAPLLVLDRVLRLGTASGMFAAFTLYFIMVEEVHWRLHLGEWLPAICDPARAYHLAHHERPNSRYNIFLPFWDRLLGSTKD